MEREFAERMNQVEVLEKANSRLESAIKSQEAAIKHLKAENERFKSDLDRYRALRQSSEVEASTGRNLLSGVYDNAQYSEMDDWRKAAANWLSVVWDGPADSRSSESAEAELGKLLGAVGKAYVAHGKALDSYELGSLPKSKERIHVLKVAGRDLDAAHEAVEKAFAARPEAVCPVCEMNMPDVVAYNEISSWLASNRVLQLRMDENHGQLAIRLIQEGRKPAEAVEPRQKVGVDYGSGELVLRKLDLIMKGLRIEEPSNDPYGGLPH